MSNKNEMEKQEAKVDIQTSGFETKKAPYYNRAFGVVILEFN